MPRFAVAAAGGTGDVRTAGLRSHLPRWEQGGFLGGTNLKAHHPQSAPRPELAFAAASENSAWRKA